MSTRVHDGGVFSRRLPGVVASWSNVTALAGDARWVSEAGRALLVWVPVYMLSADEYSSQWGAVAAASVVAVVWLAALRSAFGAVHLTLGPAIRAAFGTITGLVVVSAFSLWMPGLQLPPSTLAAAAISVFVLTTIWEAVCPGEPVDDGRGDVLCSDDEHPALGDDALADRLPDRGEHEDRDRRRRKRRGRQLQAGHPQGERRDHDESRDRPECRADCRPEREVHCAECAPQRREPDDRHDGGGRNRPPLRRILIGRKHVDRHPDEERPSCLAHPTGVSGESGDVRPRGEDPRQPAGKNTSIVHACAHGVFPMPSCTPSRAQPECTAAAPCFQPCSRQF